MDQNTGKNNNVLTIGELAEVSGRGDLVKIMHRMAIGVAILLSIFHLIYPLRPIDPWSLRVIHLLCGMLIVFLSTTKDSKSSALLSTTLSIAAVLCGAYILVYMDEIIARVTFATTIDIAMGIACVILVLEMARRSIGKAMVFIVIFFIAYALYGNILPGIWGHKGYSIARLIDHLYLYTEGIYGIPLGVSANFVILFIIFGAFLQATKTGGLFINLANAIAGTTVGGPAKISVVSSAFFGTISGSSTANVVTTGNYTIPLMKKTGYSSEFAGAVEAAASTGGQIMPPVMGAAAFVMAELTGISYLKICLAAALPSILYFVVLFWGIHLRALQKGLKGLSKEEIPNFWDVLKDRGYLLIPLLVLIYMLAIKQVSPMFAAFWAIVATVIVSALKTATRLNIKTFFNALADGSNNAVVVISACACAGIIVGVTTLTGIGLKVTGIIVHLGQGNIFLTIIVTMLASYLLGMGIPTTAAYIIVAVTAAPALTDIGIPLISAHMVIFYSALLSDITPPVALSAYAAAGIAHADPMKIAYEAMRLSFVRFLFPFLFVYTPALLFQNPSLLVIAIHFIVIAVSCTLITCAFQNYFFGEMTILKRLLLFVAALAMIFGLIELSYVIYSLLLAGIVLSFLYYSQKKKRINELIY